jgi:hypothetical protein
MSVTTVPLRPLKKGSMIKLWLALAFFAAIAVGLAWWGTVPFQYETTASGLRYQVLKAGEGPKPTINDVALIDYTGKLEDGKVFDTTKGKQPAPLPVNGSIPGFSEGLQLMSKGATYRFKIPPELAYGAQGAGGGVIPPNTTLEFEVTLHEFLPMSALQGMMGPPPQGQPQGQPPGQ